MRNDYFHCVDLVIDDTFYKNNLSCCPFSKKRDHCEVLRTNSLDCFFVTFEAPFQFSKCLCFNGNIITFNCFDEISNCLFYDKKPSNHLTFLFLLLRLFVALLLYITNKQGYDSAFLLLSFLNPTILPL